MNEASLGLSLGPKKWVEEAWICDLCLPTCVVLPPRKEQGGVGFPPLKPDLPHGARKIIQWVTKKGTLFKLITYPKLGQRSGQRISRSPQISGGNNLIHGKPTVGKRICVIEVDIPPIPSSQCEFKQVTDPLILRVVSTLK